MRRPRQLALEEFVRRAKAGQILGLRGSGLWEGDLAAMRRDLTLLHVDRDYEELAGVSPLRQRRVG